MRPAASNPSWDTPFSWPGLHFDVSLRGYYEFGKSELSEWQQTALDYSEPCLGGFRSENNGQVEEAGRCVQGTLSLFDNNEEDGGFHCVPGCFKDRLKEWVQRAEKESPGWFPEPEVNGRYNMRSFGPDIEIGSMTQRVPCPAGTLTLFDATLPHGTKPNASAKSRAIIFLRYLPSDALPASVWANRNRSLKQVVDREGFVPNQREAQVLFGPQF
jgi:ectoine hydroxylase-related dioxygenase (phytanoyl-CoA dioxygenase family)